MTLPLWHPCATRGCLTFVSVRGEVCRWCEQAANALTALAGKVRHGMENMDAAEPGAAFEDISAARPLTLQDCERAMRILMNPPLRLPEEVHGVGCAKFKRRACDCGAAPLEQIFDEELTEQVWSATRTAPFPRTIEELLAQTETT